MAPPASATEAPDVVRGEPYEVQSLKRLYLEAVNTQSVEVSRSPSAARVAQFKKYIDSNWHVLCDRNHTPESMLRQFYLDVAFCSPVRKEDQDRFDRISDLVTEIVDAINAIEPSSVFIRRCDGVDTEWLVHSALRRAADLLTGYAGSETV